MLNQRTARTVMVAANPAQPAAIHPQPSPSNALRNSCHCKRLANRPIRIALRARPATVTPRFQGEFTLQNPGLWNWHHEPAAPFADVADLLGNFVAQVPRQNQDVVGPRL